MVEPQPLAYSEPIVFLIALPAVGASEGFYFSNPPQPYSPCPCLSLSPTPASFPVAQRSWLPVVKSGLTAEGHACVRTWPIPSRVGKRGI